MPDSIIPSTQKEESAQGKGPLSVKDLTEHLSKTLDKEEFYKKVRNKIAQCIIDDENYIKNHLKLLAKLKSADEAFNCMIEDAHNARIEEDELGVYPNIWIRFIAY